MNLRMLISRSFKQISVRSSRHFHLSNSLRQVIPKSTKIKIPSRSESTIKNSSNDNELTKLLQKLIDVTGPISLSSYMRQCLTHPEFGYYTSRDPLGPHGDFITSPEISQMFGELIGVWYFTAWLIQGKPKNVNFIEFGPGKGTLVFDVMRSFSKLLQKETVSVKLNIVLVEASPVLKLVQHKLLSNSEQVDKSGVFWKAVHKWSKTEIITWVDTEKDVFEVTNESDTNFVIAHEFFDALPIKKFNKTENGWREISVDFNKETNGFFLTQIPHDTPSSHIPKASPRYESVPVGASVEISADTISYSKDIAKLITRNGNNTGAALIIDYGLSDGVPSESLRGIKDHKIVNPFEDPGDVDLSVDVDFEAIKEAVGDLGIIDTLGPVDQGDWLLQLGITERTKQLLSSSTNEKEKDIIYTGYRRLIEKDEYSMGKAYKFLGLVPKGVNIPVGFSQ